MSDPSQQCTLWPRLVLLAAWLLVVVCVMKACVWMLGALWPILGPWVIARVDGAMLALADGVNAQAVVTVLATVFPVLMLLALLLLVPVAAADTLMAPVYARFGVRPIPVPLYPAVWRWDW